MTKLKQVIRKVKTKTLSKNQVRQHNKPLSYEEVIKRYEELCTR